MHESYRHRRQGPSTHFMRKELLILGTSCLRCLSCVCMGGKVRVAREMYRVQAMPCAHVVGLLAWSQACTLYVQYINSHPSRRDTAIVAFTGGLYFCGCFPVFSRYSNMTGGRR